jgi:D-amino-acid dehydrogenase
MGEGLLFCFTSAEHIRRTLRELEPSARHGYTPPIPLNGDQLRELEPALSERVAGGFLVPQERYLHPGTLTGLLDETVRGLGVTVREDAPVSAFERTGDRVTGVVVDGGTVAADEVLIAAGAWTGALARQLDAPLPIQAGKGYSFSVRMAQMPARPLYLHESRVGASPFGDRLRLAGTMELSGVNTRFDRRRVEAIARSCQPYFREPLDTNRTDEWVGMRPLAPDGLPVIGRLRPLTNAFVATGHGMLGVTLGPATGELMADLMTAGTVPAGLEAFSPARFGR